MIRKTLTATAVLLVEHVFAQNTLRMGCSQLVIERIDPIVQPGVIPSSHTHQIVGGNGFNATMAHGEYDPAAHSTCTTCTYSEDFSNYWTASMYFKSPENGSYRLVPQMANYRYPGSNELLQQEGGITVYYIQAYGNTKATAFKPGFRMIAGDPALRSKDTPKGICHRCNGNGGGDAPCDMTHDTAGFPLKPCPGGIMATILFPPCWDGKNVDSPDHRSHVAYPGRGGFDRSACPSTHPVRVPQVMIEIMWDTRRFNNPKYFEGGKQPFVYSFGDDMGGGQHGDYLFGWKGDALQRGMDALGKNCSIDTCSALKIQSGKDAIACTKKTVVAESVGRDGDWLKELPGSMQVTS